MKLMSEHSIVVDNLHRNFRTFQAVRGISFEIPKGSVCGFIGANGAGKTTTMSILATLDQPTSGRVEVGGYNVMHHPDKVRGLLGWMPDDFGNYSNMSVLDYLDFYARALGYRGKEREARILEVMEFADLLTLSDRPSNKLSKGMTQRLCLGRALIHDPEVLIMDEPAAGLDPKARVELKHLIRLLADEGKTVFISSHILSELGEMCDSLLFIDQGKIVYHGDADSLKAHTSEQNAQLFDVQILNAPEALADWVLLQPGIEFLETRKRGGRLQIQNKEPGYAAQVLRKMVMDGLEVTEFHKEEQNLEDAFIHMLGKLSDPSLDEPDETTATSSSAKNLTK